MMYFEIQNLPEGLASYLANFSSANYIYNSNKKVGAIKIYEKYF